MRVGSERPALADEKPPVRGSGYLRADRRPLGESHGRLLPVSPSAVSETIRRDKIRGRKSARRRIVFDTALGLIRTNRDGALIRLRWPACEKASIDSTRQNERDGCAQKGRDFRDGRGS